MALEAIKALNGLFTMRVGFFLLTIYLFICLFVSSLCSFGVHCLVTFFCISLSLPPQGSDQPLIVRFADPKKPRLGEPRFYSSPYFIFYSHFLML